MGGSSSPELRPGLGTRIWFGSREETGAEGSSSSAAGLVSKVLVCLSRKVNVCYVDIPGLPAAPGGARSGELALELWSLRPNIKTYEDNVAMTFSIRQSSSNQS